MSAPRVVVFAYSEVGAACLESLFAAGAEVSALFTHEDDPNENIWFRSAADIARGAGIPVHTSDARSPDVRDAVDAIAPDVVYSFYYRKLIPMDVLSRARLGAYNMHGSLLPRYRGRAPVNWAVVNGETETGATLHVMTAEPDKGPIVGFERVPIAFEDTAHDVFMRVAEAASRVVSRCHPAIASGAAELTEQDESKATRFGRRTPEDGLIDWSRSAVEIYNLVRGTTKPFPGAFTYRGGRKLMIWRAYPLDIEGMERTAISDDPLVIACGRGSLEIRESEFVE